MTLAYVGRILFLKRLKLRHIAIILAALAAVQLALLTFAFDLRIEKDIIGRLAWFLLSQ